MLIVLMSLNSIDSRGNVIKFNAPLPSPSDCPVFLVEWPSIGYGIYIILLEHININLIIIIYSDFMHVGNV